MTAQFAECLTGLEMALTAPTELSPEQLANHAIELNDQMSAHSPGDEHLKAEHDRCVRELARRATLQSSHAFPDIDPYKIRVVYQDGKRIPYKT